MIFEPLKIIKERKAHLKIFIFVVLLTPQNYAVLP